MDQQYLAQLIEWIKQVSPLLMSAARQKVFAETISYTMGVFWYGAVCIAAMLAVKWGISKLNGENETVCFVGMIVAITGAVLSFVMFMIVSSNIGTLIGLVAAPDYSAIKYLLDLAKAAK